MTKGILVVDIDEQNEQSNEHITLIRNDDGAPLELEHVNGICGASINVHQHEGRLMDYASGVGDSIYWPLDHSTTCSDCAEAFKDEFGLPETESEFCEQVGVSLGDADA